jgi:SAM-dependent methyltransferase
MLPYAADMESGWRSEEYVAAWAAGDDAEDLLAAPRALTVELVRASGVEVEHVLDLGAGTGVYLATLLEAFQSARGTWVDASEQMRELARVPGDVTFVLGDLSRLSSLRLEPGQVVVTSRVVHDLPPPTHGAFYTAVFDLLEPGGLFFNLDHVGPRRAHRTTALPPHRDHPLAALDEHVERIAAAGFDPPDVPWRLLDTALIAARRPV